MIIHPPTSSLFGKTVQISSRIEFQTPQLKKRRPPSELWFRFPQSMASSISLDSDPFAVALLLLAMQNGEPLEVKGSLSRKLFYNLIQYQKIYHSWFPNRFKMIEIKTPHLRDDVFRDVKTQACAFSGGVDSFYTLLSLLKERPSEENPINAVFMAGFDMPLHLTWSIEELHQSYSALMKEMNVHFISGSTNIRQFVNSVDWTNAHGQALAATALFFKNSWDQFYIPSSYSQQTYPIWGTHPDLDHLLSTESLTMIHHGNDSNRVQKLEKVTQAPESYHRLRVCWIQDIGLKNCGQCEKCLRTMVALDILDKLPFYSTFEKGLLTGKKIRTIILRTHQSRLFAWELMKEAFQRKKYVVIFNLAYSLFKRKIMYTIFRLFKKIESYLK